MWCVDARVVESTCTLSLDLFMPCMHANRSHLFHYIISYMEEYNLHSYIRINVIDYCCLLPNQMSVCNSLSSI